MKTVKGFSSLVKKAFGIGMLAGLCSVGFANKANATYVNGIYQIVLEASNNGSNNYCLDVDISKIGTLPGAELLKVEPCRNIREQRWLINQEGIKIIFLQKV
jgi:hypothetical protein